MVYLKMLHSYHGTVQLFKKQRDRCLCIDTGDSVRHIANRNKKDVEDCVCILPSL